MSTDIVVHEGEFEQDIRPHAEAIAEYISEDALAYSIADAVGFEEAGQIVNEIKRRMRDLDAVEKTATKPMLAALDTVRGWFRPAKQQAQTAREIWDGKIKAYLVKQQAVQEEVQKSLQAAAQKGDGAGVKENLARLEPAPQAKGVVIRQVWKFEVVDRKLVPPQYWVLDEAAIGADVRKGVEVPGVRAWQEAAVSAVGK